MMSVIKPTLRYFESGVVGAGPGIWYGVDAPDGGAGDWLRAPVGSIYIYKPNISVAIAYLKTANNGAGGDWVSVTNTEPAAAVFNVMDYGAMGNNSNDDTAAIVAAVAAAVAAATTERKTRVWFPPGYRFRCSATLNLNKNTELVMDSLMYHTGTEDVPAIILGNADGTSANLHHKIWVRRLTYSNWSSEDVIGVKSINLYRCYIEITLIMGFTIGLQCVADVNGWVYNEVHPLAMIDNQIGIDMFSVTALGWVNENLFVGGNFQISSSGHQYSGNDKDVYGVRIGNSNVYTENNNVFLKPSFELGKSSTSGECIPVWIVRGGYNSFRFVRTEAISPISMRIDNVSHGNTMQMSYGQSAYALDDDSGNASNSALSSHKMITTPVAIPIFDSGDIRRLACYANGSTTIHVPRMHLMTSSSATPAATLSGFALTDSNNYLTVSSSRGVGLWLDTSLVKRFVIVCDTEADSPGAISTLPYDANGDQLLGNDPYYVMGEIENSVTWYATTFGNGRYALDTPASQSVVIRYHASVTRANVWISSAKVRRMQIFALHMNSNPKQVTTLAYVAYEQILPNANIGSAAPSAGTWAVGRRVYNIAPAAGGTEGWVCVEAGTPGTWKAFGAVAA